MQDIITNIIYIQIYFCMALNYKDKLNFNNQINRYIILVFLYSGCSLFIMKLISFNAQYAKQNINVLQKGFTLIELMFVIAIIGILASFGVATYAEFVARSQAAEVSTLAENMKILILDNLQNNSCVSANSLNSNTNVQKGKYGVAIISGTPTYNSALSAYSVTGCMITYQVNNTHASPFITNTKIVLEVLKNGSLRKNSASNMPDKYIPNAFI